MRVFASLAEVALDRPQAVTIGVFDGVHRGHHYLISRAAACAAELDAGVTVVTFWPPPAAVLQPQLPVACLMTLTEKLAALAGLGTVDNAVILPFTREFAQLEPADFMAELRRRIPVRALVEGDDFTFGHERAGNVAWLQSYGAAEGIRVEGVTRRDADEVPISSSRIRKLVTSGDVAEAAELLGKPYRVCGEVVHGDGRGRQLGFPTANLRLDPVKLIPANGIYAARCWRAATPDEVWQGAASIGVRPVFNGTERRVEVYILDIDLDLYGATLCVDFVQRLREERNFANIAELIAQMGADVAETRRVLQMRETGA